MFMVIYLIATSVMCNEAEQDRWAPLRTSTSVNLLYLVLDMQLLWREQEQMDLIIKPCLQMFLLHF